MRRKVQRMPAEAMQTSMLLDQRADGPLLAGVDVGIGEDVTTAVVVRKKVDGTHEVVSCHTMTGWTRERGVEMLEGARLVLSERRFDVIPGEETLLRQAIERLEAAPEVELPIGLLCLCESRIALWKANGKSSRFR